MVSLVCLELFVVKKKLFVFIMGFVMYWIFVEIYMLDVIVFRFIKKYV